MTSNNKQKKNDFIYIKIILSWIKRKKCFACIKVFGFLDTKSILVPKIRVKFLEYFERKNLNSK